MAVDLFPEDAERIPPSIELGKSVIRERLGKGGEIRFEDGTIRQFHRLESVPRERVIIIHKSDGFLHKRVQGGRDRANSESFLHR